MNTDDPFDERPAAPSIDRPGRGRWSSGRVAAVAALMVLVIGAIGLAVVLKDGNDDPGPAAGALDGGDGTGSTTTTEPVTPVPTDVAVEFGDHEDPAAALGVTTDVRRIEVAPGKQFTIEVTISNRTGRALELDGCPYASATWTIDDGSGDTQRSSGSVAACVEDVTPWADGEAQTKTFDFTAPDLPDQGAFTAVIEFSDPEVTVTVPGVVTG